MTYHQWRPGPYTSGTPPPTPRAIQRHQVLAAADVIVALRERIEELRREEWRWYHARARAEELERQVAWLEEEITS